MSTSRLLLASFVLAGLAGCGSCRGERPRPTPAPAAASSQPATPAPVSTGPTATDFTLLGAAEASEGVDLGPLQREARSAIASYRTCASAVPEGTEFTVRLTLTDTGAVREAVVDGPTGDPARECLLGVARGLRFTPLTPGTASASTTARYRGVRRTESLAIDPSLGCEASSECVFVRGDCGRPFVVNRLHAEYVDTLRGRALEGAHCEGSVTTQGYAAMCHRGVCTDVDVPLAEVACTADAQCRTLVDASGAPRAVAKAQMSAVIGRTPGLREAAESDAAPRAVCRYGACLVGWAGGR